MCRNAHPGGLTPAQGSCNIMGPHLSQPVSVEVTLGGSGLFAVCRTAESMDFSVHACLEMFGRARKTCYPAQPEGVVELRCPSGLGGPVPQEVCVASTKLPLVPACWDTYVGINARRHTGSQTGNGTHEEA